MYNTCYGGFTLSDAAIDEYKRRNPEDKNPRLYDTDYELDRDDQVMAQIVKEMGCSANGHFSDIKLQRIPVEYRDFYTIYEYDGLESVLLNHNVYQLEAIKSLVKDCTLSDKLARIAAVISQEEPELSQA
jgi:hypothetical protein